jgi:hypothetical protein
MNQIASAAVTRPRRGVNQQVGKGHITTGCIFAAPSRTSRHLVKQYDWPADVEDLYIAPRPSTELSAVERNAASTMPRA